MPCTKSCRNHHGEPHGNVEIQVTGGMLQNIDAWNGYQETRNDHAKQSGRNDEPNGFIPNGKGMLHLKKVYRARVKDQ
jgi:hypothetical protein